VQPNRNTNPFRFSLKILRIASGGWEWPASRKWPTLKPNATHGLGVLSEEIAFRKRPEFHAYLPTIATSDSVIASPRRSN